MPPCHFFLHFFGHLFVIIVIVWHINKYKYKCIWHYKEQIRNILWAFIILTHPSVLQELDCIIYTRGGGSWYFRPRSRGGLANFTPIAGMGHLISEPKFKIPTPPLPPCQFLTSSLPSFHGQKPPSCRTSDYWPSPPRWKIPRSTPLLFLDDVQKRSKSPIPAALSLVK